MKERFLSSERIQAWATHPRAHALLYAMTFLGSWILPFPSDPLFAAISVHKRERVWKLALMCIMYSCLGGIVGYSIGYFLFTSIATPVLSFYGYTDSIQTLQAQFQKWGFWLVVFKGLTPVPYKLIVFACGMLKLNMLAFFLASIVSRSIRFFGLAVICWKYDSSLRNILHRYFSSILFIVIGMMICGFVVVRILRAG